MPVEVTVALLSATTEDWETPSQWGHSGARGSPAAGKPLLNGATVEQEGLQQAG